MKEIKSVPISDIRVYRSNILNIDGNTLPEEFATKSVNVVIKRIAMKLRESGFSLGEFDHLYLNFTTCLKDGIMIPSGRSIDIYHKWYRYYDVGVTDECYQNLSAETAVYFIAEKIEKLLNTYFAHNDIRLVKSCIEEAIEKGENMLMLYKTKRNGKNKAEIYLQLLDTGEYCPNLFVYDKNGVEVLHKKMPCTLDLMNLGEIRLSGRKVTVIPRKNSLAQDLESVSFEL